MFCFSTLGLTFLLRWKKFHACYRFFVKSKSKYPVSCIEKFLDKKKCTNFLHCYKKHRLTGGLKMYFYDFYLCFYKITKVFQDFHF